MKCPECGWDPHTSFMKQDHEPSCSRFQYVRTTPQETCHVNPQESHPCLVCDARAGDLHAEHCVIGKKQAVLAMKDRQEAVNHPAHYGGADNPYEAIKVIKAWKLGFCLGNTLKYIARAEHKGATLEDLKKARWYLDWEIKNREQDKKVPYA